MTEQYLADTEAYLKHQKGLSLLWLWMDQWSSMEGWTWDGSTLALTEITSSRFVLGAPKRRRGVRGTDVFLGAQSLEANWLKRISWRRAVWDAPSSRLWLVSALKPSPDVAWPDIPSIAVGLLIDPPSKLAGWSGTKLDLRSVWWDESNILHVSPAPDASWSVRHGALLDHWPSSERSPTKTLHDLVQERIQQSNIPINPGFSGQRPTLSEEQASLVGPFASKGVPSPLIEQSHPELFGQFFEPPPKS